MQNPNVMFPRFRSRMIKSIQLWSWKNHNLLGILSLCKLNASFSQLLSPSDHFFYQSSFSICKCCLTGSRTQRASTEGTAGKPVLLASCWHVTIPSEGDHMLQEVNIPTFSCWCLPKYNRNGISCPISILHHYWLGLNSEIWRVLLFFWWEFLDTISSIL